MEMFTIFLRLGTAALWAGAQELGLCFVYLRGGHIARECSNGIKCNVTVCGGGDQQVMHTTGWRVHELTEITCKRRPAFIKLQEHFVSLSILPIDLKSANREIISIAILDNKPGTAH